MRDPTRREAEFLRSMLEELLVDDWAYWWDDPAVAYVKEAVDHAIPDPTE